MNFITKNILYFQYIVLHILRNASIKIYHKSNDISIGIKCSTNHYNIHYYLSSYASVLQKNASKFTRWVSVVTYKMMDLEHMWWSLAMYAFIENLKITSFSTKVNIEGLWLVRYTISQNKTKYPFIFNQNKKYS